MGSGNQGVNFEMFGDGFMNSMQIRIDGMEIKIMQPFPPSHTYTKLVYDLWPSVGQF
jgi:hypothetical protein